MANWKPQLIFLGPLLVILALSPSFWIMGKWLEGLLFWFVPAAAAPADHDDNDDDYDDEED